MAIVKNNYVKRGGRERANAKATIRYIQNRPRLDKTKTSRTLFGRDGAMDRTEAYRMIDEAEKGSIFFRLIISPDPAKEDSLRDLRLREVTEQTMLSFEERMKKQVQWVAAEHDDHAPHRHVHIMAIISSKLSRQDFQALPGVLRTAATEACLEQRQELDRAREQRRQEQEEAEAVWEQAY
jgi:hypothetical protein